MPVYISILRGINVSGQKLIKMAALKSMYEDLGFNRVTTYVQSGNVVFTEEETHPDILKQKIFDRIKQNFGFEVPVIVLTIDKLKHIVDSNPLLKEPNKEESFLHVTFLSSVPDRLNFTTIEEKKQPGEEVFLSDDAVYLYCPNGYGRTKLTNNFLETKLKTGATTRNWKTTNELLKIAQEVTNEPSTL